MIFAPIQRTGSFETIGYEDLWKRGARAIYTPAADIPDYGSPEREEWNRAVDASITAVAGGLKQGSLLTYVYVESEGQYYRVPPAHWQDEFDSEGSVVTSLEGEPLDTLFCFGMSRVPVKFHDLPLLFFVDEVEEWERALKRTQAALAGGFDALEACIARADEPSKGYWKPITTLAWIVTREAKTVAGVQLFENESNAELGDLHSSAAWCFVGDWLGQEFGKTLRDASIELQQALECGTLTGGIATDGNDKLQKLTCPDWTRWKITHGNRGLELLPGLVDFKFPSDKVRDAFPPVADAEQTPVIPASIEPVPPKMGAGRLLNNRRPTQRQIVAFQFFEMALQFMPGGSREKSQTALHGTYLALFKPINGKPARLVGQPLSFTQFKTALRRHGEGLRITRKQWTLAE